MFEGMGDFSFWTEQKITEMQSVNNRNKDRNKLYKKVYRKKPEGQNAIHLFDPKKLSVI